MTSQALSERVDKLRRRFRRQSEFARGYSPLYARLFGLIADWMDADTGVDPLVDWLVHAAAGRASFDVPLVLMAGLHREILHGSANVSELAAFFPTVGGTLQAEDAALPGALRTALFACQSLLEQDLRSETVQTNETGRGLCWLLPVLYPRWQAVHLVELGASAGLNLAADYRSYRLLGQDNRPLLDLNFHQNDPAQFSIRCQGVLSPPARAALPRLLSRTGCDLHPCTLSSKADERRLASFIWGDQAGRLASLEQGIAALQAVKATGAPVQLYQANLPNELIPFLNRQVAPADEQPIVLFNTYLTTYLHDKGASLRPILASWAAQRRNPLLWLQWETLWEGPEPPHFGWIGWTADLWWRDEHRSWHLAWVHPHGNEVLWRDDLNRWAAFWRKAETI